MASRREQKAQARERRLAAEQAHATRTRRVRRVQLVAGVVAIAVVVVVVAIVVSSSASKRSGLPATRHQTRQVSATVAALLRGIPQSQTTLGDRSAPVTMTYYGDLECPYCARFTTDGGFGQLVANQVRHGEVKVRYASLCTATCNGPGQNVFDLQQVAADAAGRQHRFWDYAELFYREQGPEDSGYVTQRYLASLARQTPNLQLGTWRTDRRDPRLLGQVETDMSTAEARGVRSTPTLVMSGPRGRRVVSTPADGIPTYADLQQTLAHVS